MCDSNHTIHQRAFNSHSSQLKTACVDQEKTSLPGMEALSLEDCFHLHKGKEKWPTQCQPRPFYSQAQMQPCCLHPLGVPTHLLSGKANQDCNCTVVIAVVLDLGELCSKLPVFYAMPAIPGFVIITLPEKWDLTFDPRAKPHML